MGQGQQPPNEQPHLGNQGAIHGFQNVANWAAADPLDKPFTVLDELRAASLWRVSIVGPVVFTLTFGTKGSRRIEGLRSPAVFEVPGQCSVTVRRVQQIAAECSVTCTPVFGGGLCFPGLRLRTSTPAPIPSDVQSYFALTVSALTVDGIVVAVPALTRVPLVSGSVLVSGDGYLEFTP